MIDTANEKVLTSLLPLRTYITHTSLSAHIQNTEGWGWGVDKGTEGHKKGGHKKEE